MARPRGDPRGGAHGGADRARVVAHPPERAARRRRPREGWLGRLRGEPEPPPGQTAPDHPGRTLRAPGDPPATAHVGGVPRRGDRGGGAAPGERHAEPRTGGPDVLLLRATPAPPAGDSARLGGSSDLLCAAEGERPSLG